MKEKYKLSKNFIGYFRAKRKSWNPMRWLLGDYYYSRNFMKADLDIKDIKIIDEASTKDNK